jgi:erythronate-4-phosphate dehydrogenase
LHAAVRQCYDIERDHAALQAMRSLPVAERPAFFTALRLNYPVRRGFTQVRVDLPPAHSRLSAVCPALGFLPSPPSS